MSGLLLERERELAVIADALRRMATGDGGLVLLEGPAGIGKTVLLERAGELGADAGVRVLAARGGELELEFPFGLVRQLFEPVMRQLSSRDRAEVLAGAAGLAAPVVTEAGAVSQPGEDRSFAVLHGLYWLTANLAERGPLLMAVDDLHWADGPSLRFLLFLARRLAGLPVVVIGCMRPGEPIAEPSLLSQLGAEPVVRVLRPGALSEAAVAELIRDGLGQEPDERFVRACHAATGGTPFLVRELVAALAADGVSPAGSATAAVTKVGPATVARATLLRIARVSGTAIAVARAAAVLGAEAEPHRVARLASLDPRDALRAADGLVGIHVFANGRPWGFVHPIVRAAVYDDLAEGERVAAHALAAELLSAESADLDVIAAHLLQTAPAADDRVVEQLRVAATRAVGRGAPENAVAYLWRAQEERLAPELRAELLFELGGFEATTRPADAIEHLREAQRLAGSPVLRARVGLSLADAYVWLGHWDQAITAVDKALAELGDHDRGLAISLGSYRCIQSAFDPRLGEYYDRRHGELLAALDEGNLSARGLALLVAAISTQRLEDLGGVLLLVERALGDGGLLTDERETRQVAQGFGALVFNDELDRAAVLAEDALSVARSSGSLGAYLLGVANRAWIHARRGDLQRVEADLRAGIERAQEQGLMFAVPSLLWFGLEALVERPGLADIAELALVIELPPDLAATYSGAMVLETRARIQFAMGDYGASVSDLRAVGQIAQALRFRNPNSAGWRSWLALALAAQEPDEALRLARSELEDARLAGLARGIGVSLRTLGVLEGGESGLTRLAEAVTVLEDSPARLEHARAMVELGAALRRANRRGDARGPLADGLELARRCGATRLADRARDELRAAGARPRREVRAGVDALTPSELRVAEMAADGLSNPQIAQALFVTRNTIETHMRHIFQKLDVSSRDALAQALSERGRGKITDPP